MILFLLFLLQTSIRGCCRKKRGTGLTTDLTSEKGLPLAFLDVMIRNPLLVMMLRSLSFAAEARRHRLGGRPGTDGSMYRCLHSATKALICSFLL